MSCDDPFPGPPLCWYWPAQLAWYVVAGVALTVAAVVAIAGREAWGWLREELRG